MINALRFATNKTLSKLFQFQLFLTFLTFCNSVKIAYELSRLLDSQSLVYKSNLSQLAISSGVARKSGGLSSRTTLQSVFSYFFRLISEKNYIKSTGSLDARFILPALYRRCGYCGGSYMQ